MESIEEAMNTWRQRRELLTKEKKKNVLSVEGAERTELEQREEGARETKERNKGRGVAATYPFLPLYFLWDFSYSSPIPLKFLHPPTISAHKLEFRVSKLFFMSD